MKNRNVTVAAIQFSCSWQLDDNLNKAERLIREAVSKGAQVILTQELFRAPYFCIDQSPEHRQLAEKVDDSVAVKLYQKLAKELNVVLPCSIYEKSNNSFWVLGS